VPGLLVALLALRILDPPRGAAESIGLPKQPESGSPYRALLRTPTLLWIIATGVVYNFNSYAYSTFLPAYLSRYHGQTLRQSNTEFAIMWGWAGIVGLLVGGWLADRVTQWSANGRMLVGAVALLLSAAGAFVALNMPPGRVLPFVIVMGAATTAFFFYYPCVYATIQDVVPASLRGTAMAIYFLAMYLLGGSFGPVIVGRISDHFARQALGHDSRALTEAARAVGLHSAMYVLVLGCVLVAVALFGAATTVARDMGELQRQMPPQRSALLSADGLE